MRRCFVISALYFSYPTTILGLACSHIYQQLCTFYLYWDVTKRLLDSVGWRHMSSTTLDGYPEGIYRWQNNFEWILTTQDLTSLIFSKVSPGERPQTYALDRAATGTCK
jgi:hypothetical protein